MFALSLYTINKTNLGKTVSQKVMYGIALGLILYSSIYVYLLFYNESLLTLVNQFIIYILIADLTVSLFYYYKLQQANIIKKVDDNVEESVTPSETESNEESESEDESGNTEGAEGEAEGEPQDIFLSELEVIKEI